MDSAQPLAGHTVWGQFCLYGLSGIVVASAGTGVLFLFGPLTGIYVALFYVNVLAVMFTDVGTTATVGLEVRSHHSGKACLAGFWASF